MFSLMFLGTFARLSSSFDDSQWHRVKVLLTFGNFLTLFFFGTLYRENTEILRFDDVESDTLYSSKLGFQSGDDNLLVMFLRFQKQRVS